VVAIAAGVGGRKRPRIVVGDHQGPEILSGTSERILQGVEHMRRQGIEFGAHFKAGNTIAQIAQCARTVPRYLIRCRNHWTTMPRSGASFGHGNRIDAMLRPDVVKSRGTDPPGKL